MRNISQLAASMMLLATQVNAPASVGAATAAKVSARPNQSVLEVRINTNTADPVDVVGPKQPDFDTEVLAPLRAAQAKAEAARVAKATASRKRTVARTVSTSVVLPAGSHTDWMAAAGISASDFGFVDYIISRESGWGVTKPNYGGSGAYGLGQALPASKMAPFGADYLTNPVTQLKWANSYAVGRYGSWAKAYAFWTTRHFW